MESSAIQVDEIVEAEFAPVTLWNRLDERMEQGGEWLNPILVKETRQALKSRQFTFTFVLLLLACLVWSIMGVAVIGPEIFYLPSGPLLFEGYYLILCLPLTVIVPFSAFRSLITEQEDNTYELLSITTLSPRQIVTGKLGSAVVQIIVYFSAVAPCLGFSYLLRGLDLLTVTMLMIYAFLGSLALSTLGLLAATLSKQKMMSVLLSVGLLAGLFLGFLSWWGLINEILRWGGGAFYGTNFFWPVHALLATLYLTTFPLVALAAAARLNFPGENGSTPLRALMLVQQCCFVGWCSFGITVESEPEVLGVFVCLSALYWWGMGCFFSGESPELSSRVKRHLPKSLLGRGLLTWFYPGPGKGYVFAVANVTVLALLGALVLHFAPLLNLQLNPIGNHRMWTTHTSARTALACAVGYVAGYLGVGGILITLLRRRWPINMLGCVILQVFLLCLGFGIPLAIQMMSPTLRDMDYTLLQITNPGWTFVYLMDGAPNYESTLAIVVPSVGLAVFLLYGLLQVVEELRQVRTVAPPRVREEEASLQPVLEPRPLSPWD